jgi:UDP-glucose 4-epimerase
MISKKILVTGGAGYIGSHTVKELGEAGYDLVIYDNLSTSSPVSVLYGKLIIGDINDLQQLSQVFAQYQFAAVLHFAASISVPESVTNPLAYYANNTRNTLNLLQCCQKFGVEQLIFSSTAAVYGDIGAEPVQESDPTFPVNPYGRSKLMSENIIKDYSQASKLKYIILRYFNVAGADITEQIGQYGKKTAHLIKIACDAALGRRSSVNIFGTDYPTLDGTGIRDYIHVQDLAKAHVDALSYLENGGDSQILNCGYGKGYSVRQVLDRVKAISGVDFPVIETERRRGDPASVVAAAEKIKEILGWEPKYNDLDVIISTALNWEKKLDILSRVPEKKLL